MVTSWNLEVVEETRVPEFFHKDNSSTHQIGWNNSGKISIPEIEVPSRVDRKRR